ncbi:MAG TPA: stalk domain-containing protein [Clostridia bacterium]|nr:stalk domain-containing protein [Clostridia bacterium]
MDGDLKVTGSDTYVVHVFGTLTLAEDASIDQTKSGEVYAVYNNGGTVNITDGNIQSTHTGIENYAGELTISDGEISGSKYGIRVMGSLGQADISGGSIQGSYALSVGTGATADISGGTFTGTGDTPCALSCGGTANITGGTFNGTVRTTSHGTINVDTTDGNVNISGGVGFYDGGITRTYLSQIPDPDDLETSSNADIELKGVHTTGVSFSIESVTPAGLGASISGNTVTLNPTLPGEYSLVLIGAAVNEQTLNLTIPVTVTGSAPVCKIGDELYYTLDNALADAEEGQTTTIELLQDILYEDCLEISNKSIIFELGEFSLTVDNPDDEGVGLDVNNGGVVSYTGTGSFSVSGTQYGVKVSGEGSGAAVTGVTVNGNDACGVDASSSGEVTVGSITVQGDNARGVEVYDFGKATVNGDIYADGDYCYGVWARKGEGEGGTATVNGDVTSEGDYSIGVLVENDEDSSSTVTINGSVEATSDGLSVRYGTVNVTGSVKSQDSYGARLSYSEVTIDGEIDAPSYLDLANSDRSKESKDSIDDDGYWIYNGWEGSIVKVGNRTNDLPTVITYAVSAAEVTSTGAILSGSVTSEGSSPVTAYGFEYGIDDYDYTIDGDGTAANFTADLTGLTPGTTYHVRAYARNSEGLSYGSDVSFTTDDPGDPGSPSGSGGRSTSAPAIGKANPPEGRVGASYTHTFTVNRGTSPYTYKVTGGTLPEGLSLARNGTLNGTPETAGTYKYTVTVTDRSGRTSKHTFTHVIGEGTPVTEPVPQMEVILTVDSLLATVDGQPYTLEAEPFINAEAGRTLVPVRFISEALGADVDWVPETQQVIIRDGDTEIILTIGSATVLVNGTVQTIDCAPVILPPGRTFVPLRFISETLNATVEYDGDTGQITITR